MTAAEKAWRAANPDKVRAWNKKWRLANKEKVTVYARMWHREKRGVTMDGPEAVHVCAECGKEYHERHDGIRCGIGKRVGFRGKWVWFCDECFIERSRDLAPSVQAIWEDA